MNLLAGFAMRADCVFMVKSFTTPPSPTFMRAAPYESEDWPAGRGPIYKIDGERVYIYSDVGTLTSRNKTGIFDLWCCAWTLVERERFKFPWKRSLDKDGKTGGKIRPALSTQENTTLGKSMTLA